MLFGHCFLRVKIIFKNKSLKYLKRSKNTILVYKIVLLFELKIIYGKKKRCLCVKLHVIMVT